MPVHPSRQLRVAAATAVAAIAALIATACPAWAAESITLTWVRHAQSTANAEGVISSTVPGPGLTTLGEDQALAIAATLAPNAYDGIYASDMVRTQLTAAPLAADLGITPVIVGGVREIAAGILEGLPGTTGILYALAGLGYIAPAAAWVLGARLVPGIFGEDGNIFDARVDEAIAQVYASGDTNPVVFSHGGTIQAWTLMNVTNPVLLPPLENTGVVVMTGNPEDGWTLRSWAGTPVAAEPNLLTKLFMNFRDLVVAPQTAIYNIGQALEYQNWYPNGSSLPGLLTAIGDGIVAVATAAVDFVVSSVRDIIEAIIPAPSSAPAAAQRADLAAAVPQRPGPALVTARAPVSQRAPVAPPLSTRSARTTLRPADPTTDGVRTARAARAPARTAEPARALAGTAGIDRDTPARPAGRPAGPGPGRGVG